VYVLAVQHMTRAQRELFDEQLREPPEGSTEGDARQALEMDRVRSWATPLGSDAP
jgi:hypothetical protein